MKLDNPLILTEKHPNMGNLVGVTNGSHNFSDSRYLVNLKIWDEEEQETKTLKKLIQYLTAEKKYLKTENRKLMKIHQEIGALCKT
ncbi:MAG: hypothetical protein ACL7BU_15200 [Candidatus Phlomobacter fragariae]